MCASRAAADGRNPLFRMIWEALSDSPSSRWTDLQAFDGVRAEAQIVRNSTAVDRQSQARSETLDFHSLAA